MNRSPTTYLTFQQIGDISFYLNLKSFGMNGFFIHKDSRIIVFKYRMSNLDPIDFETIWRKFETGDYTKASLAKEYNVCNSTITNILKDKNQDCFIQLKQAISNSGYYFVAICSKGKIYRKFVHHLMLESFVRFRKPGEETRHLDGNKLNNKLENLCWGTPKENYADQVKHGMARHGEKCNFAKLNKDQIKEIRSLSHSGVLGIIIADMFNISKQAVSKIINRKVWKHI